jgi:hypothetical protein
MAIEITNPRHVRITLHCEKKGKSYKVIKDVAPFLEGRGWRQEKLGRSYATMTPPANSSAPFSFEIEVPSRQQIIEVALEKHSVQETWEEQFGAWTAFYIPPRAYTTQRIDIFRPEITYAPLPGGILPAHFCIGTKSIWSADVLFGEAGVPSYFESDSQSSDTHTDNTIDLFVSRSESESPSQLKERFILPDEINQSIQLVEGASVQITVNAFERNQIARQLCIEAHGSVCCICGFDFGLVYGLEANGYIHVHHLLPLSEIRSDYIVDPVADLRPVCPNCHAFLHMGERCRTIQEVQQLLAQPQSVITLTK